MCHGFFVTSDSISTSQWEYCKELQVVMIVCLRKISSMLLKKHKVTLLQRTGVRLNVVVSDIQCMHK